MGAAPPVRGEHMRVAHQQNNEYVLPLRPIMDDSTAHTHTPYTTNRFVYLLSITTWIKKIVKKKKRVLSIWVQYIFGTDCFYTCTSARTSFIKLTKCMNECALNGQ